MLHWALARPRLGGPGAALFFTVSQRALKLQRPLPAGMLEVVARGEKKDAA
jgi:hypothetical protein